MKNLLFILIITGSMGFTSNPTSITSSTSTPNLTITISGYRNEKGQFGIALYNNENQFTDNPWKTFQKAKSTAIDSAVTLQLKNIPKGTYAVSFLDDENSNEKMDYAFLGYPKEGFGFSNNAQPGFLSAPKYEACTFEVKTDKKLQLKVQYWSK